MRRYLRFASASRRTQSTLPTARARPPYLGGSNLNLAHGGGRRASSHQLFCSLLRIARRWGFGSRGSGWATIFEPCSDGFRGLVQHTAVYRCQQCKSVADPVLVKRLATGFELGQSGIIARHQRVERAGRGKPLQPHVIHSDENVAGEELRRP